VRRGRERRRATLLASPPSALIVKQKAEDKGGADDRSMLGRITRCQPRARVLALRLGERRRAGRRRGAKR